MPFLRSRALRPTLPAVAAVLTAGLAVLVLTAVTAPARAEDAGTPAAVTPGAVTPTSAAIPRATDAAAFCTRPTGRWWEDYAADGCATRVAGRTAATPLTPTELSWLDLGDLPADADADVDVDALGAELARYEAQALAAADTAGATVPQPRPDRGTTRRGPGRVTAQWIVSEERTQEILALCDYTPGTVPDATQHTCLMAALERFGTRVEPGVSAATAAGEASPAPSPAPSRELGDQEMSLETRIDEECRTVIPSPTVDLMPGSAEWDGYFRALAVCVDERLPGYLARWEQAKAEQEARYEEDRLRTQPAWDRLRERRERAFEEVRRCPHGGWARPTKHMASSPDEVDYVVRCHPDPAG